MAYRDDGPVGGSDRGSVAEALLCASRASHVGIGCFSRGRLAVTDAEIASASGAVGQGEALLVISRTFGLHAFEKDAPAGEADRGVLWLSSERCLIGIRRRAADPAPFVALVRPPSRLAFPRWQHDIARIALHYECVRSDWTTASAARGAEAGVVGEIMARLDVACALTDAGRNLIYANESARSWLAGQSALRVVDGRICASGCERQRRLADAIRAATIDEPPRTVALIFRDEGALLEGTLSVTCVPLPGGGQQALLIFGHRARSSGALAELLLGALGLTTAERRLARPLLAGRTLEEASGEAGIKLSTARGYLKAIFAKTGVRRQSEFIAVVGGLVPPVLGCLSD